MLPISQEEFNRAFLGGLFQGLWMVWKAGWPYFLGLIGLKILFHYLERLIKKVRTK